MKLYLPFFFTNKNSLELLDIQFIINKKIKTAQLGNRNPNSVISLLYDGKKNKEVDIFSELLKKNTFLHRKFQLLVSRQEERARSAIYVYVC